MKKKIVGIFVMTLLIGTAVLPVVGTMNEVNNRQSASAFIKNQEVDKGKVCSLYDVEVEWERFYGDSDDDLFRNVKQTSDGGYIAVGVKDGQSHWLLKVDENGDEEWSATALPNPDLWPRCYIVEQTSDGGFITAGCQESDVYLGYDRCIWKVDENGNTEWLKTYDDPLYGYHMCIQETSDGGYIVSGEIDVDENNPSDFDVLLMKTDSNGNVEWQQIWRYGEYGDNAYAVRQTPDGGYILSGRTESSSSKADFLIIKTDSNGNIEWDKTYGGEKWEQSQSGDILFSSDGGYIFLAETRSYGAGNLDVWLIKTDSHGNMEWNKTFGGKRLDMCGGMDLTDDGGIIISASYDVGYFLNPKGEGLVIKTNENGNIEWQKTFGCENNDQLQGACSTNDGGYIVAGLIESTDTTGAGGYDAWFIKFKSFENQRPNKPSTPSGPSKGDPETEYTFSTSSSDPDGDSIQYMWDWGDGNFSELLDTSEATYTWTYEDNFEVRVMAIDEHGGESDWSDPLAFSTPKNKIFINTPFMRFLENYPHLFPLLRQLLGLQ